MSTQPDQATADSNRDIPVKQIHWNKLTKAPILGIIGGGQLAQMMYQSAISLGIETHLFASVADEAAPKYFKDITRASSDQWTPPELYHFAQKCDVVTFDHELVPPALVRELEKRGCLMLPSSNTLELSANKANQRIRLSELGLEVPEHQICNTESEVISFGNRVGWPLVIKPSTGGYDGKGVYIVSNQEDFSRIYPDLASLTPLVIEPFLHIDAEGSVLAVRSGSGECKTYPMVRTIQLDGMCREVVSPSGFSPEILDQADNITLKIAQETNVVGVLAVEFFLSNGRLLVNELAPRPHNTGHLTIEANVTSQFENHLRAVLGLPLGETAMRVPAAAMVNVISGPPGKGTVPLLPAALSVPGASVHLYSKSARKNRKIGHVTSTAGTVEEALATARSAVEKLTELNPDELK